MKRNRISINLRIIRLSIPATVMLLVLCGYMTAYAQKGDVKDIEDTAEDLNHVRQEIEAKRQHLTTLTSNEKSVLGNIRSLEQNIDLTSAFIRKLDRTSNLLLSKVDRLTEQIDSTSEELEIARGYFFMRLEAIYKRSLGRPRLAFLLAGSLSDAIRNYHLSRAMIEYDNELVEAIRGLIAEIETQRANLARNRSDLGRIKKERNSEKYLLSREKSKRQNLLSRVRAEKKLQKGAIAQLEREAAELERLIEDLRASRTPGEQLIPDSKTAFYRFKRRLPWPVKGGISARYGDIIHPIYKTRTFNPGIDITSPYGTAVEAAVDGRIAYIGYLRGYGNFILIDHNEGYYTLYARLSEIKVGTDQEVLKGDIIGNVGDAGEGNNPALHFEIRRGKKTYNPLEWLE